MPPLIYLKEEAARPHTHILLISGGVASTTFPLLINNVVVWQHTSGYWKATNQLIFLMWVCGFTKLSWAFSFFILWLNHIATFVISLCGCCATKPNYLCLCGHVVEPHRYFLYLCGLWLCHITTYYFLCGMWLCHTATSFWTCYYG